MRKCCRGIREAILAALIALVIGWLASLAAYAQGGASSDGVTRLNVTAVSTGKTAPPKLTAQDIVVFQSNERRPVVNWVPVEASAIGLDVVIVVDDSADPSLGTQLRDLAAFIHSLPGNAQVQVVYASNGVPHVEQAFTTEREAAVKALRLPRGDLSGSSGLYDALRDLAKRWPDDGAARVVVLVSEGVDLSLGLNNTSPYRNEGLRRAIETFQKNAITAYGIYASSASHVGSASFLVNNGQGCLFRLTKETGGLAYANGFRTAIDFGVYLRRIRERLSAQYLLTFRARAGKQAGFAPFRVTTELPGIELSAPSSVYVAGS